MEKRGSVFWSKSIYFHLPFNHTSLVDQLRFVFNIKTNFLFSNVILLLNLAYLASLICYLPPFPHIHTHNTLILNFWMRKENKISTNLHTKWKGISQNIKKKNHAKQTTKIDPREEKKNRIFIFVFYFVADSFFRFF